MTAAFWDANAETLEDARSVVWAADNYDQGVIDCLQKITAWVDGVPEGGTVLDLGCGIGRLVVPLALLYPKLNFIGLDHSYKMLWHAEGAARDARAQNIEYVQGALRRLQQSDPVDGIFSFTVLQHIEPRGQQLYVYAAASVLKPGGWLRIQWTVGDEGDVGPLAHPVAVRDMQRWVLQAGLDITTIEGHDHYPTFRWLGARKP